MDALPTPTPAARSFIVLTALLQGLLLYWAETGIEHGWWPFSQLGGQVCWYTLVLSVPIVMTLTVQRLDDARFWQHAIGALALFALLSWWAAWSATGEADIRASSVLGPFGFTLALALFIALPYLQCRLQHARWCAPYADLFEFAWQNGLVVILTAVFTGLCWGVLFLCAELFELIEIRFFSDLFRKDPFIYLATGVMVGLGILIGRTQPQAVRVARTILLAIFKGLLPMLALIALMFLVSLPFSGLEPLWKTRFASGTLFLLLGLMVLFVNAVYQDGRGDRPYPTVLRRLVELSLLGMPAFALIALYALWLRVAQYGWTQDRYWAALVGLVLAGYSVGYAVSIWRRGDHWLPRLPRTNIVLSLAIIALAIGSNSPLLDPHRLTIASQTARLDPASPEDFDARHLRFDSGRRGVAALRALQEDPRVAENLSLRERIAEALEARLPDWERERAADAVSRPTLAQARERLRLAPDVSTPPDDLLETLIAVEVSGDACLQRATDCVLLDPDLDQDGAREWVLCQLDEHWVSCRLWYRQADAWKFGGTMNASQPNARAVAEALRAGRYELRQPRWSTLRVGEAEFTPARE